MVGSKQYTVTSTPVLIASSPARSGTGPAASVFMSNTGATVYLGGVGVTSSNGVALVTTGTLSLFLFPGDDLYAVCGSSSVLSVLQT